MKTQKRFNWCKKIIKWRVLLITTIIFLLCLSFHWVYFKLPYRLGVVRTMCKILHFIFLYLIIYYLDYLITHLKDNKIKVNIICVSVFFVIMLILVFLTWPGAWCFDDVGTVEKCQRYKLGTWQHSLTSVWLILCLQTLPFIAGVPIVQSFIAALIVGYIISNLVFIYGKTRGWKVIMAIVLMIVMLAPSQIIYLLSGFRMGLYSYIEILLISHLLCLYKNKASLTWYNIILISGLTVLVASWRSEAFYYPVIVFFALLLFGRKQIKLWKNFVLLSSTIILTCVITEINTYLSKSEVEYSLTGTIDPVVELVQVADESDSENLVKIGKVLDIEKIKANPGQSGEFYFHGEGYVLQHTESEYKDYLFASVKLAMKYPNVVIKNSCDMFSKYLNGTFYKPYDALNVFNDDFVLSDIVNSIQDKIKNPVNVELRTKTIKFLLGMKSDGKHSFIHYASWNLLIPVILMGLCLLYKLLTKKWFDSLLILLIVIRFLMLFLTAVAPFFMYYLSVCLCAKILAFISFIEIINWVIDKKNRRNQNTVLVN